MTSRQHFVSNLWKWKCGLPEEMIKPQERMTIVELARSEWSVDFEGLMRSRLIMGAFRYGRLRAKGKPRFDRVSSMESRLLKYRETGNKEYLVDVANLCLVEFTECHHPREHFVSVDDGEHAKRV